MRNSKYNIYYNIYLYSRRRCGGGGLRKRLRIVESDEEDEDRAAVPGEPGGGTPEAVRPSPLEAQ